MIKRLLNPLEGKDGQLSIRRILAFAFSIDMILEFPKMTDGQTWTFACLIAGLLGLTTWQNMKENLDKSKNE